MVRRSNLTAMATILNWEFCALLENVRGHDQQRQIARADPSDVRNIRSGPQPARSVVHDRAAEFQPTDDRLKMMTSATTVATIRTTLAQAIISTTTKPHDVRLYAARRRLVSQLIPRGALSPNEWRT
jgi:hypothetical protein